MASHIATKLASLFALSLASSLPATAENVSQETPSPAACTKTVNAMGAPMGHKSEMAPNGRPIYRFLLRTNGLDYDVLCDAATGVVSDVTPRATH